MKHKQYNLDTTIHTINIFHIYTQYRFLKFSCKDCKLHKECEDIKHKQDICCVANDINNILSTEVIGRANGFNTDCFFIKPPRRNSQKIINNAINILYEKYQKPTNVR